MRKIRKNLCKIMYSLVVLVATISVNVTCYGRFYQEKLDQQLDGLRKYKDGR